MKQPRLFYSLKQVCLPKGKNVHLAIGMFDGVHLGHQAVLASARQAAQSDGGIAVALTFTPHPTQILQPDSPKRLLMDSALKMQLLFFYGAQAIIEQPFDASFAQMQADEFPALLKQCIPLLSSIHVGENFRYGQRRAGSAETLARCAPDLGLSVKAVGPILEAGDPVSSTRIRGLLTQGRIEEANKLLGHPYLIAGRVVPGRQIGRTIGFPTLNLQTDLECRPRYGVYAVSIYDHDRGLARMGVANYGLRPTVQPQGANPLLEVHILGDDCPWNAGEALCVSVWGFLRAEQKFPFISALKAQIQSDKTQALEFFAKHKDDISPNWESLLANGDTVLF